MMVQLKGSNVVTLIATDNMFQFHDGTIKSVDCFSAIEIILKSFNSMMVQLKGDTVTAAYTRGSTFQFHDGTIKSMNYITKVRPDKVSIP